VRQEYIAGQRRKANEETIQALKDRYKIIIDTNGGYGS